MLLKPLLAVAVVVLAVAVYGIVPAVLLPPPPGGTGLSAFDGVDFASGYSDLGTFAAAVKGLQGDPASNGGVAASTKVQTLLGGPTVLCGIQEAETTAYFAAGVSRDYRSEEVGCLVDFVKRGGKVIVADDFGYANTLAQKFGIFYFGTDLWDLDDTSFVHENPHFTLPHYDRNISLPIVAFTFAGQDYFVEMNAPTGITLIQNPEIATNVIGHCSEKCYADIDRSATVNIGDKKGNITMIMSAQILENKTIDGVAQWVPTKGVAYFISDASIFTNEMMGKPSVNNSAIANGNLAFAKALISTLLPQGGVVVIDESRHLHNPGSQVVYASFEAGAVASSKPELAAALVAGAGLILGMIVLRAKDRDNWIHRFDLSTFHPRRELPEMLPVQVTRLRNVARLKIQMTYSMGDEEFAAVPIDQLRTMIRDPLLVDLILNAERPWAPEELRAVSEHIRTWGK